MDPTNELVVLIDKSGLADQKKADIKTIFLPLYEQAKDWNDKGKALVVTSIDQKKEMKDAREARLAMKNIRVAVEKKRVDLKEESLRTGKAIDEIAKLLTDMIKPTEAHLEEQEKFAERYDAEQKEKLTKERILKLKEVEVDGNVYINILGDMTTEQFDNLLTSSKQAMERRQQQAMEEEQELIRVQQQQETERIERERLAEVERLRQEEENERLRQEAKRLREEQKQRDILNGERMQLIWKYADYGEPVADLGKLWEIEQADFDTLLAGKKKAYDDKQEEERLAREEQARQLEEQRRQREEQQRQLQEEQKKRELAETQLREKQEQEEQRKQEEQARVEEELKQGDKAKFINFIKELEILQAKYQFKSEKYNKLYEVGIEFLKNAVTHLQSKMK